MHYYGEYRYSRFILIFRVSPLALQARLADEWKPTDEPGGNLGVGFCNVILSSSPNGNPVEDSSLGYVVLNGTVRNRFTGETANMRYATYASSPQELLTSRAEAADSNLSPAAIEISYRKNCSEGEVRFAETCLATAESGGTIGAEVSYTLPSPEHVRWETRMFGRDRGTELELDNEEVQFVLLDRSSGVDHLRKVEWKVSVPELDDLFTGDEVLEAVVAVPWSVRKVYGPDREHCLRGD